MSKHICSFCGKSEDEVDRIIASPTGSCICNFCVDLCVQAFEDEKKKFSNSNPVLEKKNNKVEPFQSGSSFAKPMEIKKNLDDYVIGQDAAKKLCRLPFIIIINEYIWALAIITKLN